MLCRETFAKTASDPARMSQCLPPTPPASTTLRCQHQGRLGRHTPTCPAVLGQHRAPAGLVLCLTGCAPAIGRFGAWGTNLRSPACAASDEPSSLFLKQSFAAWPAGPDRQPPAPPAAAQLPLRRLAVRLLHGLQHHLRPELQVPAKELA